MKKHRNHKCYEWENHDIVKRCVSLLQPHAMKTDEIEVQIHHFCAQLEKGLRDRFAAKLECNRFLANVESVFGVTPSTSKVENPSSKKFTKILSTISKVLQYSNNDVDNVSNVELLTQLPTLSLPEKLIFPDVNDFISSIFNKQEPDEGQLEFVSESNKAGSSKEAEIGSSTLLKCKTIKTTFINPRAMCPTDTGVVFIDDEGIFNYTKEFTKMHFKPYTDVLLKTKAISVVHHELRKSVFLTTEINTNVGTGYLMEYSLPRLNGVKCLKLPLEDVLFAQYFIAVCNDGRIICCQGIDSCAFFWIQPLFPSSKRQWVECWSNDQLQAFLSLHHVKKSDEDDYIYIQSQCMIYYEFRFTKKQTKWLRSIELNKDQCNLFVLFNQLYYFNDNCFKFHPFLEGHHHYNTQLTSSKNHKKLLVSTNEAIYFLNCEDNELKICTEI